MARLDSICKLNMGQSPDSSSYNESQDGLPFFQGNADFGVLHPKVRVWCSTPTKLADDGDILISVRAPIGALNIADQKCCIGRGLAALTVDEKVCQREYLWHAIGSKVDELNSKGTGSTFKAISKNILAETEIPLPPLDEQKRIAANLDKVSNLISLRKQQLETLDEMVKARFVEMFDVQKCQRKTLGECTDFVDYRGHTPELSDAGTIRMVNAKSVGKGFFKYVDEYVTEETYDSWMHRGFGYSGDILFVTEGHTFGNTCLIPNDLKKFALGQRVITIKGHKELLNAFLCSYMQTDMFWKDINVYRTGGTAQGIRSKDLVKVFVPIPPLDLQNQFAAFVEQTDKSKLAIQNSLDQLETLKKALMQQYFG